MEKLKLTADVLFAGIGCQERGFWNTDAVDLEVLAISEIDRDAVMSYSSIHKQLTPEMVAEYDGYPTEGGMVLELTSKNIGYDAKKEKPYDWNRFDKNRDYIIKSNWLAGHLANNLGDISRIGSLPEADIWICSFPCQDISIAGYQNGFREGTGTRSSLLWEQIRLLQKAVKDGTQPKFMLYENVAELAGKKFKKDFLGLLDILKGAGYKTHWKILNAKDFGIPQNRERLFLLCIREDIETGSFSFPQPYHGGVRLEDILSLNGRRKMYLNVDRAKAAAERLGEDGSSSIPDCKRDGEENEAVDIENIKLHGKDTYAIQKLTPEMCFLLMGMTTEDVKKCKDMGVSDTQLYRQAGNGIVTNVIQLLAEHLYKAVADKAYVCTDEKMNGKGSGNFHVPAIQAAEKSA